VTVKILQGHVLDRLNDIAPNSVQVCVTSPPYYGLRSYGTEPQVWGGDAGCEHVFGDETTGKRRGTLNVGFNERWGNSPGDKKQEHAANLIVNNGSTCSCNAWRGELGQEPTLALYLDHLLMVFDAVKRVLRDDGCLFVNLGDSYDTNKSLYLMPPQFALMMKARGWIVRNDLIWAKTACMPESVTDRATRSHEYIFHFAKSARYFYDAEAVKEAQQGDGRRRGCVHSLTRADGTGRNDGGSEWQDNGSRNQRTVWTIGPEPLQDEHYAAWPTEIPRRCILAASSEKGQCPACGAPWRRVVERTGASNAANEKVSDYDVPGLAKGSSHDRVRRLSGGMGYEHVRRGTNNWQPSCSCIDAGDPIPQTVLDPFIGSGRTGIVADRLDRHCIGIELSPVNVAMSERLVRGDSPMFANVEVA
jgi:DNA modification methylase